LIEVKVGYASDYNKKHPRPANSGTVVLITRGRAYQWLDYDEHIKDLGPSQKLWLWWTRIKKTRKPTEEDWQTYLDDFIPQMKEPKAITALNKLTDRIKDDGEIITLLCYCEPGQPYHCHRYIIKELIDSMINPLNSIV
jgi:uncharacterized protein YeaO (DUF488 family)